MYQRVKGASEEQNGLRRGNTSRKLGSRIRLQWADTEGRRISVHTENIRSQRKEVQWTVFQVSVTINVRKEKSARLCPSDYSCRFTLDSSKGGGDSFHGKVCELTSSGIKRGSAAPWTGPRVPGLIHELFRYERLTRFSCLADFSIRKG